MLNEIAREIKAALSNFPKEDKLIFNNKIIPIDKINFKPISEFSSNQTIAFVDGGQAEIINSGNFCLSFIRIFSQTFKEQKKIGSVKYEFYLFTKAKWINGDLFYESKIFPLVGEKIIDEQDLFISSYDASIKTGIERAPITKIGNMARRFSELALAAQIQADFIILDGTLEKTYTNEEKYLNKVTEKVGSLAKTSSLFTTNGNNPVILLNKFGQNGCWQYFVENKIYFVKLHEKAKHVFRFEGNPKAIPLLLANSKDALFLGYPYGLILADKFARVSNEEKNSLIMNFLLRVENKEIAEYLNATNAHDILDRLG